MNPQRIQRRRSKGWRMPDGAIYVGRPSKWGNPYRITSARMVVDPWGHEHYCEDGAARAVAVRLYREDVWYGRAPFDELDPAELVGKDLVCWCPIDQPCHADVLLELANTDPTDVHIRRPA